jgi:fructokinase
MKISLHILSVGEVLWDIVGDESHLGGAPFNVCAHMAKMDHDSYIFSMLGNDSLGNRIKEKVKQLNIHTQFLNTHQSKATSTVNVYLEDGQPEYTIHENVAWDDLKADKEILELVQKKTWDVVIFGLLAQRQSENASKIYDIVKAANARHTFLDVNVRKQYYTKSKLEKSFHLASIVKMNADELALMRDLFYPNEVEERFAAEKIFSKFNLSVLIITLGGDGAWAYAHKKWYKASAKEVEVSDTIGAGDSFSAAFLHAYLKGQNVQEALNLAVEMGGFVASRAGAIPEYDAMISDKLGIY